MATKVKPTVSTVAPTRPVRQRRASDQQEAPRGQDDDAEVRARWDSITAGMMLTKPLEPTKR